LRSPVAMGRTQKPGRNRSASAFETSVHASLGAYGAVAVGTAGGRDASARVGVARLRGVHAAKSEAMSTRRMVGRGGYNSDVASMAAAFAQRRPELSVCRPTVARALPCRRPRHAAQQPLAPLGPVLYTPHRAPNCSRARRKAKSRLLPIATPQAGFAEADARACRRGFAEAHEHDCRR
jgi:hypothetical protein